MVVSFEHNFYLVTDIYAYVSFLVSELFNRNSAFGFVPNVDHNILFVDLDYCATQKVSFND